MSDIEAKIENLLSDKSFLNELSEKDTLEEMCEAFEAHGVSLTTEDLEALAKVLPACVNQDELNEETLQAVAGGKAKAKSKGSGVGDLDVLKMMWNALSWGWKKGQEFNDWVHSLGA